MARNFLTAIIATALSATQTGSTGRFVGQTTGKPSSTTGYQVGDYAVDSARANTWHFDGTAWNAQQPIGSSREHSGISLPKGWFWEDGTAYSRTTYADLFSALSLTSTATTNATTTVTAIPTGVWNQLQTGWYASGTNISGGTTTITLGSSGTVTLSAAATGSATGGAIVFSPYPLGDGSTTFNVPDTRSAVIVGSGQGSGLTQRVLGATGGEETHALTTAEGPAHTHTDSGHGHGSTGTDSANHNHSITFAHNNVVYYPGSTETASGGSSWPVTGIGGAGDATIGNQSANHSHTVGTGNASLSTTAAATGHNNMQPFAVKGRIIKF